MWWCVHEELGGFQAEATNFDQERSCGWEEEGLQEEDDLSLGRFYLHQTDLPPLHLLLASLLVSSLTKNGWRNQGGLSSGYIKFIAENGSDDDSYSEEGLALFRVQGSGPENMQAVQVEPVSNSALYSPRYIWPQLILIYYNIFLTSYILSPFSILRWPHHWIHPIATFSMMETLCSLGLVIWPLHWIKS